MNNMVTGIEHVGIYAKQSKALADWYVHMFDGKIVYENAAKGTYFVAFTDGSMIEICKSETDGDAAAMTDAGIRHLALTVDDFEAFVEKIRAEKLEILADAKVAPNGVKTIFFRDIAGNILHLISRPQPLV